ncbi:MAG: glycosyltransferase [Minisyncoccia bacterium]
MKILIAGANWHDNLLSVFKRGFESLGHEVDVFDDNQGSNSLIVGKILSRTPFVGYAEKFFENYRVATSERLMNFAKHSASDFLFVINGQKYLPAYMKKIREKLKIPCGAYLIDDPIGGKDWLNYLTGYSHLFVIDDAWMGYLEYFVPGGVYYLPQVGDSDVFRPIDAKKTHDIGFGGTLSLRLPNAPSGHLRSQILNILAEKRYKIQAFAPGIGETFGVYPALKDIDYKDSYQSHEELNKLYNSSRIVISIHSPQFKNGISPRVFEAAYAGAFQLVEWKQDADKLFDGKLQTFKSPKELFDKVDYYLAHPGEREKIADECRDIALRRHTYKQRAERIMSIVKCGI